MPSFAQSFTLLSASPLFALDVRGCSAQHAPLLSLFCSSSALLCTRLTTSAMSDYLVKLATPTQCATQTISWSGGTGAKVGGRASGSSVWSFLDGADKGIH